MGKRAKSILEAALALPEKDRGVILSRLLESLPPPPSFVEMSEEEFAAELQRRDQEMEDGIDKGVPWSEVKKLR